jgi:alkyl sulfatase BDS1-like metallo-beta-lactamase superfamily hydrolase
MTRRVFDQYGLLLPRRPYGHVDQSIGKNTATGKVGLIEPSRSIEAAIEELTIDGVRMVFQNTPGMEAPAEMNTYFPDWKAFWAAENICETIHNIYTFRGAVSEMPWSGPKRSARPSSSLDRRPRSCSPLTAGPEEE